ncbi:MAG: hypothetical protein HY882_05450, partial [Deltaproteobacteria bacterium]|nr:hypothetical protein [Deltaproteobacteria bacterium]
MGVISLRLRDRDFKRIEELSKMEHKDKSTVAMVKYISPINSRIEQFFKNINLSFLVPNVYLVPEARDPSGLEAAAHQGGLSAARRAGYPDHRLRTHAVQQIKQPLPG